MNIKSILDNIAHIRKTKKPTTLAKYIGIEFEFISPFNMDQLKLIFSYSKWSKCFNLGTDSSIRAGKNSGYELRVLCKESELESCLIDLQQLFKVCKAYTNKSCGLHVHLDMRRRNFIKSYAKLLEAQDLMFSVVNPSRKRNHYCKKQTVKNVEYLKDSRIKPDILRWEVNLDCAIRYPVYNRADRHSAINPTAYLEHKTIEVRLHEGTVNTLEVYNWCTFLISCLKSKKKITHTNYLKVGSLPTVVKTYLTKRIKQNGKRIK